MEHLNQKSVSVLEGRKYGPMDFIRKTLATECLKISMAKSEKKTMKGAWPL